MTTLGKLSEALIAGDTEEVKKLTQTALEEGFVPNEIIKNGLINGMDVIGGRFKRREIFVPEVLIAARAMHGGMEVLKPYLVHGQSEPEGKIILGSAKGDLHDIGKNLVRMMLEGAGFEVIDLGVDISPEVFVKAVQKHKPHCIGISSLLTTTMPAMGKTIEALEKAGLRDQIKVLVGGAPVTQKYADQIGADGYAEDASSAVDVAKSLVG